MQALWRGIFDLASGDKEGARLSILIFHRVHAKPDPLFPGEPHADAFSRLVAHIASRFRVLPLRAAVRALRTGTLPSRALSITFDDGYADNLTVAAPILRRHGVSATVFVASGYLDGGIMFNDMVIEALRATSLREIDLSDAGLGRHPLNSTAERRCAIDALLPRLKYSTDRDEVAAQILRKAAVARPASPMLTRAMLQSMAGAGLDIGAHTVTHPILARCSDSDARDEIARSKTALERVSGRDVRLFAYPNGTPGKDYRDEHVDMVRQAGFEAAVSTAPGVATGATDLYELPRFTPWTQAALKFDVLMLRNLVAGGGRVAVQRASAGT
jgi:peptidoglycan/xylan/chitin deacetylase (PgdA/CDA1 family)